VLRKIDLHGRPRWGFDTRDLMEAKGLLNALAAT
jgi:hypothetical protein